MVQFSFYFQHINPWNIHSFFQLIIAIILLSNTFYKKHSLYDLPKFNYIQKTDFKPVKSFNLIYDEYGKLDEIKFETLPNTDFSLIKTEKFSTKCLENNYIENNLLCPITDIKFEKE